MAEIDDGSEGRCRQHFLLVAHGVQSHVNPARALAHRLAHLSGVDDGSIAATLSVPLFTYRRMFPSSSSSPPDTASPASTDGVITYVAHSDGVDDGSWQTDADDRARRRRATAASLSATVTRLAAGAGHPITCIACTMVSPPVLDVAQDHGIPVAVFWLQPAAVLAVTYHFFHGHGDLISSHAATNPAHEIPLPGLHRPFRVSSLPSFLTDTSGSDRAVAFLAVFRELFEFMDRTRPVVIVNTFDQLEPDALAEMRRRHLDVVAVGPMLGSAATADRIHLFEHDDKKRKRYMEWLQGHRDRSVVYVSFGSVTKQSKRQMEEIAGGLRRCGRPYLLVVRKDGIDDATGGDNGDDRRHGLENNSNNNNNDDDEDSQQSHHQDQGMVVEWCDQVEVLGHAAVGCFVSHCGWNSVTEAMASGVPVVGVPGMYDQPTNACLVEEEWGVGVRGERDGDGVLTGTELARCIESVMDDGAGAVAIRERAKALKEMALDAAAAGGSAERNLRDLVRRMSESIM